MKRWSEGREQARFARMIDLNTQRNASWLIEGGEGAWKQSGRVFRSVCSMKKRKLNRVFAWCWFQWVQVWWKCQAIVQATERWNAKLFGQNALRCVVDMCIRSTERKEQLCLHACVFWTGMFTSELANCRFHRKIADFCAQRLCCGPTLLPHDAANVWKLRMGGKLADASASKWACALVSAARCKSRFRMVPSCSMHANRDGDA